MALIAEAAETNPGSTSGLSEHPRVEIVKSTGVRLSMTFSGEQQRLLHSLGADAEHRRRLEQEVCKQPRIFRLRRGSAVAARQVLSALRVAAGCPA